MYQFCVHTFLFLLHVYLGAKLLSHLVTLLLNLWRSSFSFMNSDKCRVLQPRHTENEKIHHPVTFLQQLLFFFNFVTEQLIYSVVLVSAIQQSDSVIYILSIFIYYRMLNMVPCAIQQDLFCPFYILQFASANLRLPVHPSPLPLATLSLFSLSVNLFLFCR